jgi:hypothetical protein
LALRLVAAKQDIVNLGYPEIVSKLLYERYGKLAPIIAKWFKQYKAGSYEDNPNWWNIVMWNYRDDLSLSTLTYLYETATDPESLIEAAKKMEIRVREEGKITQEVVERERTKYVKMIREKFFDETFFTYYTLMRDITSGKLVDIAPYKRLKFQDAAIKYDRRRFFDQEIPIKKYTTGFKWINTGTKSVLLAEQMHNCGSSGVMSMDPDRTILTLFGPNNKPHVMVTYSPNEKRISGDECAGSSPVKPEYHEYVLDLAHHLGARFDEERTKSPSLRVKYLLRNKAQSVEPLQGNEGGRYNQYFRFTVQGQVFYTDGYTVVSEEEIRRAWGMMDSGELKLDYIQKEPYQTVLLQNNRDRLINHGIHLIPLRQFIEN